MASRFATRLASTVVRSATAAAVPGTIFHFSATSAVANLPKPYHLLSILQSRSHPSHVLPHGPLSLRSFATVSRPSRPHRSAKPDIGARARQMQTRRLWTYALTFSCVAGFIIIVLNQFQDQLVFYVTPTDAVAKYKENPTKAKFRLGGLVLEGSVGQVPSSPEMEFVVTDLLTDILVKYEGSLPDLFREGHSVVVEGFIKPFSEEMRKKDEGAVRENRLMVTEKARSGDFYFEASEVLAKHDEKYMPQEVAAALEKNKKLLEQQQNEQSSSEAIPTA